MPRAGRRAVVGLLLLWLLTRIALGWLTVAGEVGPYRDRAPAAHDIVLYEFWSDRVGEGARPYADFSVEYPPANLPGIVAPGITATLLGWSYETTFVVLAVILDGIVLLGLFRLSDQRLLGVVTWVVGIPLLGPVALSRLDLLPAAGLVWALVLARERRWLRSGAALGVAIATKVFAGLLLPVFWLHSARRRSTAAGAIAVAGLSLLPFVDLASRLYEDLWRYHSARETEIGSLWGSALLLRDRLAGRASVVELRSGGWEVISDLSAASKLLATFAVLLVALDAARLARRTDGLDVTGLAVLSASTVTLTVAFGNVLSPQYLVWCLGAAAAATSLVDGLRVPVALLLIAAALSHLVFPVYFWDILFFESLPATVLLVVRNAILVASGMLFLRSVRAQCGDQSQLSNSRS